MLQLGRRLIILASAISNRNDREIRITTRLQRNLRFAVLYLIGLRHANRFLRALCLNTAACAQCESARISDQARTLIRRINFRRSLAINGKGRINQGMNERITNLYFSGQRNNR